MNQYNSITLLNLNYSFSKIIISCFLFLPITLCTQGVIKIQEGDRLFIGKSIEYLIDSTGKFKIEDVLNQTFEKGNTDILNLGGVTQNIWMRFKIVSERENEIFLEINAPLINTLEIFEVKNNHTKILFQGGAGQPYDNRPISIENWLLNLQLQPSITSTIYIKGQSFYPFQIPIAISSKSRFIEDSKYHYLFWGIYVGFMILALIYNLFIYLSVRERSYLYYILYILSSAVFYLGLSGFGFWLFWSDSPAFNPMIPVFVSFSNCVCILFTFDFLQITKEQKKLYYTGWILFVFIILVTLLIIAKIYTVALPLSQLSSLVVCIYLIVAGVISYRKGVATAKYYLLAWTLFLVLVIVYILALNNVLPSTFFTTHAAFLGHMTEVALLSFALADRINVLKKENDIKQLKIIDSLKENESLQVKLNQELEKKVKERTNELEETILNLKETQNQLIHSEKMASLGELTAGIAHEIQNPLNFVNNFSDINKELLADLQDSINSGNKEEIENIITDLVQNEDKILHHGKRASSIVKGMLQHSRSKGDNKEMVNINTLCDEYVKLAYHGFKGKDKSLYINFNTEFDPEVKEIMIIPQDIGRTILNIINNGFYAANERYKEDIEKGIENPEQPIVKLITKKLDNMVQISISDNGNGIAEDVEDKIFQPFFTTKPTGQGTGLGLSLSYDIITTGHGGHLLVGKTAEFDHGTTFTIQLPA
jgi:two-component system, NtrC family, sensor kinase